MNCETATDKLHEWLDGSAAERDADLQSHLDDCDLCRGRFLAAQHLLSAFPRANMSERLVTAVRRDSRLRRIERYAMGVSALAAAIIAAVWMSRSTPNETPDRVPSLESQFAAAGSTAWQWTSDTTKKIAVPKLPEVLGTDRLMASLSPAASGLAETGRGLAEGFEPLTQGAKRAAGRFLRDLPID